MKAKTLVTLVALASAFVPAPGVAVPAFAQDSPEAPRWIRELRIGVLAHDVIAVWGSSDHEPGVDANLEVISGRANMALLGGTLRPNLGLSLNGNDETNRLYGGYLWELEHPAGPFLDLGIGAAVHDGKLKTLRSDRAELGTRVLFRIPLEIGFAWGGRHRISVMYDHISNANIDDKNEGLDTFGIRLGRIF